MKKVFLLSICAIGFSALVTSCGNGKHKCPAYGSVDSDAQKELVVDHKS